jgi:preprotein translocase subunit SecE
MAKEIMLKDNTLGDKPAKEKRRDASPWGQILQEFLKTDIYKRSQGRLVRQFTCLAVWVVFALAAWQVYERLRVVPVNLPTFLSSQLGESVRRTMPVVFLYTIPSLILAVGLWFGYRLVNLPTFADFLIAVEAEMNKVSWPSRTELVRASMVVILLMFGLTLILFAYDNILAAILTYVLRVTVV